MIYFKKFNVFKKINGKTRRTEMVRTRQSKSQVSKKENSVSTVSFTICLEGSVMELLEAEDHGRA
jgi:hypothetical protein